MAASPWPKAAEDGRGRHRAAVVSASNNAATGAAPVAAVGHHLLAAPPHGTRAVRSRNPAMPLHFGPDEMAARRAAATAELKSRGLDALLCFRQESMFWLTGYDTFGYVFFQCLVLTADGRTALITRAPDYRQAKFTSDIQQVRIWVDRAGATPADDLKLLLQDLGLRGGKLGVEYDAYGLTAANGKKLDRALDRFAQHHDASDLITRLRLHKSPAEIAYVRRAADLADAAWQAAIDTARPGAFEGDILAAMHAAVFKGGGDDPGNEFIIGSGQGAMMCRYFTGRRHLDPEDQLTLEFAGTYRHYHACLMRTLRIGTPPARQVDLFDRARDALMACEAALVPGRTVGDVFNAHADTLDRAGLSAYRLNACGYSLGTTFAPNWMDWPMIYSGNPVVLTPGQVFFLHMILFDDDAGLAMTLGRTSLLTEAGSEVLSKAPLELVVR
jgi:Xaa-Pro dipeptidase